LELYNNYLKTDDLQFGFKKQLGCPSAIFVLRQIVEYYNERGSNVYIASLDASKAFDRVNHFKLFSAMLKRGLPTSVVDLMANWYLKLSIVVRWNGFNSGVLRVLSGVRQGGVLSPSLFNIYVDSIICRLRKSSLGCHFFKCYVGCIMYADDILLLSASLIELQCMLDTCGSEGSLLGISFNAKKSHCLVIGPKCRSGLATMSINGLSLSWVEKISYLGLVLTGGKRFIVDFAAERRSFFSAVNCILSKSHFTSDMVKLFLCEVHCLPIIMYSLESLSLLNAQLRDLNSWWNSVYRKIFSYNKWESVSELIFMLDRLDLITLYRVRKAKFISSLHCSPNSVLRYFYHFYAYSAECRRFYGEHNLYLDMTYGQIKKTLTAKFRSRFDSVLV
jgi:hypothetical protein